MGTNAFVIHGGQRGHLHRVAQLGASSLIAMAIAGSMPAAANAQAAAEADEGGLSQIVVVAQKRSENSQKVPVSLTAVPAKDLAATGALSAQTLNIAVPGLTINSTAVYFSPRIRGVGTTSFGPGVENPVSLYIDDVYYASQLTAPTDLSNVDQLTVLKGPQGTLFGRNATGGVMQMATRNPKEEFSGEVSTQLDQYMTSRNFFYVTGGTDIVKANLAASYITQGEGWGRNLVTGNDTKKIDNDVNLRSKILFTPTSATEIKLIGDYYKRRNSMGPNNRPLPGGTYAFPGGLATSTDFAFGGPGNIIPPAFNSKNDYDVTALRDSVNRVEGGGGSLHISQDFDFAKLVSISAYRKYKYDAYFDTGGLPFNTVDTEFTQKGWQFTQELQLVSKDNTPLSWVVGGYYFKGNDKINGIVARLWGPSQIPTLPINDPFVGNQGLDYHVSYGTESLAGFAQATYEFLPQTRITGGLRYTWEKRTRGGFIQLLNDGVRTPLVFTPTGNLSDAAPGDSISAKRLTWRVALDHDFAPNILGYVSWNRGFKSGGFNGLGSDLTETPYQPERLDAYEVGFKSEIFDRTLRLNPGFFYYKYSQIQVTKFEQTALTIQNGAKAELYGLNLDAVWQPTSSLTVNGGFEWLMKAKFKSFPNAPATVPVALDGSNLADVPPPQFVPPGGVYQTLVDAAGNQIPYAAKFSGNIGVTYTTELAGAKVAFNVNNAYNSGYYTEVDNRLRQKATNILSTSITWTAPDERVEVSIFGRNLLDDRIVNLLNAQAPIGDIVDYGNPPRTYGVSLKYRFGAM